MLLVLSVLSFACLAAAEPHYNYDPPQGGSVALHGLPVPVGAPPLPPFLAITHDAQSPIRPSIPLHSGIVPVAQPLPPYFAVRDVQVPIKQGEALRPQLAIPSPFFSSVFVPHPPFFAIRDVQVPRVPVSEEEIEEDDDEEEAEDVPQILPVLPDTLPPFNAIQHDAQTPVKAHNGFMQNIFGFHTDIAFGPPLVDFGSARVPAMTITNDIPVPGNKAPAAAPFFTAIRNQQVPIRGTLVAVESDGEDLDDVELVGINDRTANQQWLGPNWVRIAHFPMQIANLFAHQPTRVAFPELHAPAGIASSTQPIFVRIPFINSKAHEDIRPFRNDKAHPDTHKGPNKDSAATLFH